MSNIPNGTGPPATPLVDMADVMDIFADKEKFTGTFRIKSPMKKGSSGADTSSPDNWLTHAKVLEKQDEAAARSYNMGSIIAAGGTAGDNLELPKSPGIITTQLDEKFLQTFKTGRPQSDTPDYVVCNHCKKPIMKTHAAAHIKSCIKQKTAKEAKAKKEATQKAKLMKEKEKDSRLSLDRPAGGDVESADGKDKKKTAKKMAISTDSRKDAEKSKVETSKKRKALDDMEEKGPKAKKKKEKPAKAAPKPKGPVDVERQCGVPLPNGGFCARSLTCKSHSMGAKRAVPGRSQPYDLLLAAYQKKNHAKQQMEAAMNANVSGAADDDDINAPPVDSDEERDAVMAGLARWTPQQPFPQKPWLPVRRKHQFVRMREMFTAALRPGLERLRQEQQQQQQQTQQQQGSYAAMAPFAAQTPTVFNRTFADTLNSAQILQSPIEEFGSFSRSGSISMAAPPSRNQMQRKQSIVVS